MENRYVWFILLFMTLYTLYLYDYTPKIGFEKLRYLYNDILSVFLSSTWIKSSLPREKDLFASLFTKDQLSRHSNLEEGLYLAILGQVYDVTKGKKHYGPGGSYHSFVGRDASLAFISGDFSDQGLTDDVSSLTPLQIKSLHDWAQFYAKDYIYKGKLVGRYYDKDGNPTQDYRKVQEMLIIAENEKVDGEQRKKMFPPCNIEWKPDIGTRLWCTKRSGGIERDWVGVPRMLYERGSEEHRCTCVNLRSKEYEIYKGILQEYQGCAGGSTHCIVGIN